MKMLGICLVSTAALLVGCAQLRETESSTAPVANTVCKDGKVLPTHSQCGLDEGVDRKATSAKDRQS